MVLNVVSDMREVRTEPCSVMNEVGPAPDGVGADIVGKALRDWRVKPNKANQSGSEEVSTAPVYWPVSAPKIWPLVHKALG